MCTFFDWMFLVFMGAIIGYSFALFMITVLKVMKDDEK